MIALGSINRGGKAMAKFIPAAPFDIVIFGGTGDLSRRKLLPALYHRDRDGQRLPGLRFPRDWNRPPGYCPLR